MDSDDGSIATAQMETQAFVLDKVLEKRVALRHEILGGEGWVFPTHVRSSPPCRATFDA
jgi:hypothetical protein